MYLRLKIGRYAGEVREFPYEVAKAMIADGRGENAYAEPKATPDAVDVPLPVVSAATHRSTRKTGSR